MSGRVAMPNSKITTVWWFHPAIALGIPALIVGGSAYFIPAEAYGHYWKTAKHFDFSMFRLTLLSILVFSLAASLAKMRRVPESIADNKEWSENIPWDRVRFVFSLSYFLCLVGYIAWAVAAARNGVSLSMVIGAFTARAGASYELRENLVRIAGVTTMTQFGIAVIALGIPLGRVRGWSSVRMRCIVVLVLALFRAVINSERLALIELAVPLAISYFGVRFMDERRGARSRILLRVAPVLSGGVLFLIFSAFEYSRSWIGFYASHEDSFWRFAGIRLVGYYATALNNGALVLKSIGEPLHSPIFTMGFAWKFPILNSLTFALFPNVTMASDTYTNILSRGANPEFNNPSGLLLPFIDFGTGGALMYWLVCGAICGYLYGEFVSGKSAGIFLYPVLFTSLIEASRILYWSDGRFVPPILLLVTSVLFLFHVPLGRNVRRPTPQGLMHRVGDPVATQ